MRIFEHMKRYGSVEPRDGGAVYVTRAAKRHGQAEPGAWLMVRHWSCRQRARVRISRPEARRIGRALLRFADRPGKATQGGGARW